MANVSFTHLGNLYSFGPGVTHHWVWNNASAERVWAFSVDPHIPLTPPPFPGQSARVDVTRVQYRQNYHPPFEREVYFSVKNTGSQAVNYYMHMATIRE